MKIHAIKTLYKSRISFLIGIVVFFVASLFLSSCATIIRGSKSNVSINSHPPGAVVEIYDRDNGLIIRTESPANVILKKGYGYFQGQKYTVKLSQEGYKTANFMIDSHLNFGAYVIGNFFSWWSFGWFIVDPLTGAMFTLDMPNYLTSEGTLTKHGKRSVTVSLAKETGREYAPQKSKDVHKQTAPQQETDSNDAYKVGDKVLHITKNAQGKLTYKEVEVIGLKANNQVIVKWTNTQGEEEIDIVDVQDLSKKVD